MERESNPIAVFSLAYQPFVGGAEIAIHEIIQRMPKEQFVCFTRRFDASWPKRETEGNETIVRLGRPAREYYGHALLKLFYVFLAYRAATRMHREEPFKAIWAIMASYGGMAALLFKLRHPKIPLLLTLQEGDSETHILKRVGIFYPIWRLIFLRADRIQVISSFLKSFAERQGAICPITVIPNGVDLSKFKPEMAVGRLLHKMFTIITTSRLVRKNGIDILVKAIVVLKKEGKKVRLLIIGGGPEEEALKILVKELDVQNEVEFIGQVASDAIPGYLKKTADVVFVRPSRSEGLGSSFLEAMAAGIPIIGTPVGGISDFLFDRETGLFVREEDPIDLAKKIRELIDDSQLWDRLRKKGLNLIQRYSWDQIAEEIEGIFLDLKVIKRVVIATGIFPPDIGGSASYAAVLTEKLPAYGCAPLVVTYGKARPSKIISVSRGLPKPLRHGLFFLKVYMSALHADVVLSADASFGAGFFAMLAARAAGVRALVRVTGDYAWEQGLQRFNVRDLIDGFQKKRYGFFVEALRFFQKATLRLADQVIVPSAYLGALARGWGIREKKIQIIYNAVEPPPPLSYEKARHALGITGDVIVSAGRLVPWKGFEMLIRSLPEIKKDFPRLTVFIVGDGPECAHLEKLSKSLGVSGTVRFLGILSKDMLQVYLQAADLFVLNTSYEGFSHQLIEAMLVGIPVLSTEVGGNRELAELGKNITLIPYNDAEAFQKNIVALLNSKAEKPRHYIDRSLADRVSVSRMIQELVRLMRPL
jgi:glycosyltransferase involved in cell wall biosynthesis